MEANINRKSRASTPARQNLLRAIPQVDEVLQWLSPGIDAPLLLIKQTIREELDILRQSILKGKKIGKKDLSKKKLIGQIHEKVQLKLGPNFKRVINATGVVIHTNLGRSILSHSACEAASPETNIQ